MPSKTHTLAARYGRIAVQLAGLFAENADALSRMATAAALLHYKMPHFFWTGFYRLVGGDLLVGPYQGPLACSVLESRKGACWLCLERAERVIVPNVHEFPGHIPCDSRANSEIVVPVRDVRGEAVAVLDVDSVDIDAFSDTDVTGLERVAGMIYNGAGR